MADARVLLNRILDEKAELEPELFEQMITETLRAEKERNQDIEISCKKCGQQQRHRVKVNVPDYKERTKALQILLAEAKGKPAETHRIQMTAAVALKQLDEMSGDELRAIVYNDMTPEMKAALELLAPYIGNTRAIQDMSDEDLRAWGDGKAVYDHTTKELRMLEAGEES